MKINNPRTVASETKPRSILITKSMYYDIYPMASVRRTIPVIFGHNSGRAVVEKEIAEYLIKHYDGLSIDPYIEPEIPVEPEPEPEPYREPVVIPEIENDLEERIPPPEGEENASPSLPIEEIETDPDFEKETSEPEPEPEPEPEQKTTTKGGKGK